MVKCPYCKDGNTITIDTRFYDRYGPAVRRTKACLQCEHRFMTTERIDLIQPDDRRSRRRSIGKGIPAGRLAQILGENA